MIKTILERDDLQTLSVESIAYLAIMEILEKKDPELVSSLKKELEDQRNSLKLIASENYSSIAVQMAMGNYLTDKYAEGHPFHRFYAGCDNIDSIESRACDLAKKIFGAEHAYVQPHSGADANLIAYWAILIKRIEAPFVEQLGKKNVAQLSNEEYEEVRRLFSQQKMMGLSLDAGGHLTHGSRVNFSSKMMKNISYGVDPKSGLLDYAKIKEQAIKEKPAILVAGYSAYPRLIDFEKMRDIADSCGATLLVDMAHFAGLVAGKQLKGKYNPMPYADVVTSTTHKTLRGPRGGIILCKEEFAPFIDKGCPYAIGGPLPHIMAAKLVAFTECLNPEFETYAQDVILNAKTMAKRFVERGAILVTGGTDNHLLSVDVMQSFGLTGRQAESLLSRCKITVNRNSVPMDKNGAWYTSGIRLGTPALTTRGLKKSEMVLIVDIIFDLLAAAKPLVNSEGVKSKAKVDIDEKVVNKTIEAVETLLEKFVLYPEILI
ncbi:MAG: Serine hydroxymethyltransferase [Chlamydiia bacterium]|nr:Serine hydroxymethyltransferase [Chlamydiia bacterium]